MPGGLNIGNLAFEGGKNEKQAARNCYLQAGWEGTRAGGGGSTGGFAYE